MLSEAIKSEPIVSVVLGSFNRLPFLRKTIESIRNELNDSPHEIIVVDGGSTDGSIKWLTSQKDVLLILQHNRGEWQGRSITRKSWGHFMNLGFRSARAAYICMLSDDCLLVPGAILKGIRHIETQRQKGVNVGAGAFYWRNWPYEKQYRVGLTIGTKIFVNHGLYLKGAMEAVGYADESKYIFYHADGDLCLKMWRAGFEVIECPDSYVEHFDLANKPIKAGNLKTQQQDWEQYKREWVRQEEGMIEPEIPWIFKKFEDHSNTASKYFWLWTRADTEYLIRRYVFLSPDRLRTIVVLFFTNPRRFFSLLQRKVHFLLRNTFTSKG